MTNVLQPFHLLVIALAGWLSRYQQTVIDYLTEENRVLKEQLEGQRLRSGVTIESKVLSPISVMSLVRQAKLRVAVRRWLHPTQPLAKPEAVTCQNRSIGYNG